MDSAPYLTRTATDACASSPADAPTSAPEADTKTHGRYRDLRLENPSGSTGASLGAQWVQLLRARNGPELRVSVDGPLPADRYREVWLINSDGQRMYSLGVLPESGTGTYPLPTLLADGLDGFTIVDVSIEPYDANPEHSRNSQVRGSLPE